ncbi:hypothetical protein [Bacillus pseudomycoides]|uniref:hypothetical protein n=1 Tax=Bacillus pseudomycoides TaxID=64104 RepID=UPI003CF76DDF
MNYIVRKAALHDIQPLINLRVTLLKEVDEFTFTRRRKRPKTNMASSFQRW